MPGSDVSQRPHSYNLHQDLDNFIKILEWLVEHGPPAARKWAAQQFGELVRTVTSMSRTDSLTELPNRAGLKFLFTRLVAEMVHPGSERREVPSALIVLAIDVVGFKNHNRALSYVGGNRLLVDIARLLEASIKRVDVVSRPSGDEFVCIVPVNALDVDGRSYEEVARSLVERLHEACRSYSQEPGHVKLGLHIGATVVQRGELMRRMEADRPVTLEELLIRADPKYVERFQGV